ncbi:ribonuclease HIII [Leuconostoc citreum]
MQIVLQVSIPQLKKMAAYYAPYAVSKAPKGAVFAAKLSQATITAYKSGKVLFQGSGFKVEAARWQDTANQPTQKMHASHVTPGATIPTDFANWSVIGSDEVGAGAYFGPLTTAAVFVSKNDLDWVKALGIADSKTLTDAKMRDIAPEIIQRLPHHVVNLLPEKYNALQPHNNVNQLKAISHNFALHKVLEKIAPITPDAILIDQFAQATTYFNYLSKAQQSPVIRQNVYFTTKGEQYHLSVAAASILARVVELDTMVALSHEAGMTLPIGAGKAVDLVAAKLIRQGQDLNHFAKLHFANTAKAKSLVN